MPVIWSVDDGETCAQSLSQVGFTFAARCNFTRHVSGQAETHKTSMALAIGVALASLPLEHFAAADDRAQHLGLWQSFRILRDEISVEHDEISRLAHFNAAACALVESEVRRFERVQADCLLDGNGFFFPFD